MAAVTKFENNRRDSTGAQTITLRTPWQQCEGVGSSTSHNRAVRRDLRFAFISLHRRSRNTAKIYCVIQWIVIWARWILGNVALYFPVLSGQLNLHRASLLSNSLQPTSFPGLMRRKGYWDVGINFFSRFFFWKANNVYFTEISTSGTYKSVLVRHNISVSERRLQNLRYFISNMHRAPPFSSKFVGVNKCSALLLNRPPRHNEV